MLPNKFRAAFAVRYPPPLLGDEAEKFEAGWFEVVLRFEAEWFEAGWRSRRSGRWASADSLRAETLVSTLGER